MSGAPLVAVHGLAKSFKLYARPWDRALEWASAGRLRRHQDFWALRDVSFELARGECFGVLGANGAGKTTLLRILSSVIRPTRGSVRVAARAAYSLLELGTGLHPDLTGAENVRESARLLGLPRVDDARLADIRAFADLDEYFDRPVRFYSSGMLARLGFSLFAFLDPDLLIVDEVLAVGDEAFQAKCADRIEALRASGAGLLLVSHDMLAVRRLCSRGLVLDHGRPAFLGPASDAIYHYEHLAGSRHPAPRAGARGPAGLDAVRVGNLLPPGSVPSGGGVEVRAVRVLDAGGRDTLAVPAGGALVFELLVAAPAAVEEPDVGVALFDRLGTLVFGASAAERGEPLPALEAGEELLVRFTLEMGVSPGVYTFGVTPGGGEPVPVAQRSDLLGPLEVSGLPGLPRFHGAVELPAEFRHGPVEPAPATSPDAPAVR